MNLKKFLAVILSVVLLVGVLPVTAFAETADSEATSQNMELSSADISLSGTNSVGAMLAAELEEATSQNEGSGNVIYSAEIELDSAYIELSTAVSCTLFVGIYTEDTKTLLSSGYIDVTPEDEYVFVTLDSEAPDYFYVKAFLIDTEDYSPLSAVYNNAMYTQEMQEFLSKTTDDFDVEKVINFDDDKTNNFAVLSDEVVVLDEEIETNKVKYADTESQIYILENIDETVSSLKIGHSFSCTYNEEVLIIKVGEISIDGTTATILGADAELEEVFDYVRLDGSTGITEDTVDDSYCGEGITFEGYEDSATTYGLMSRSVDGLRGKIATFGINFAEKGSDGANVSIKGNFNVKLVFSPKVYISTNYKYIELKFDYNLSGGVSITGNLKREVPVAYFGFKLPGIIAEMKPKFVISASGSLSLTGTLLKGTLGYGWYSDVGGVNLCSSPKTESEIKANITIFLGFKFEPKIEIIDDCIAYAEVVSNIGVEAVGTIKENASVSSLKKHNCDFCVEGEIYGKFDLTVKGQLLSNEKWSIDYPLAKITIKICDFYWSMTHNEFAFTTCPHISYKLSVIVSDTSNRVIPDANVSIDGKNYTTSKNGTVSTYLPNGEYTIYVYKVDFASKEQTIYIKDNSKSLNIKLKDGLQIIPQTLSLGGYHSAAITENGDLYTWGYNGYGQLGDGTTTDSKVPKKIMSNVASVSLGYWHSAAITENGDLYMWGYNGYGQLGDGTTTDSKVPKKIMSNVASVSLGIFHSGVILKTGELYMWGINAHGQLGDGTTTKKETPIKIMNDVVSISLGGYHSAAITENGDLYMWGWNSEGQIGDNTTNSSLNPKKIKSNIVSVSLGNRHSAAITNTGELYLWGNNCYGQLGDGTTINSHTPKKIMNDVTSIGYGTGEHSSAVTKNGDLYMWGPGYDGQCGDGTKLQKLTPKKIIENVTAVSLGYLHSAAITKTGEIYLWGYNNNGQLGDGSTNKRYSPTKITLPSPVMISSTLSTTSYFSDTLEDGSFENLEPNSVYNFYIMKNREAENAFGSDNLLYINQGKTDDTGAVTFDYTSTGADFDTAEKFVVKFKDALPDNTVSDMIITASAKKIFLNLKDNSLANGGYENIRGKITLNGESTDIYEYSVNNDHLLFTYDISDEIADNMVITAQLFADYGGITYEAKEYHCTLMDARSDVNVDGSVNTFDLVVLRDAFMENTLGDDVMFDPNADSVVDARDLVHLKKYLAGVL